jgi:putative AlgH/UPF0301 family transcriptional regulator
MQLEGELSEGSWEIKPATREHIFWNGIKDLWDLLTGEIQASQIAEMLRIQRQSGNPNLN